MGQHIIITKPIDRLPLHATCMVSSGFPCQGRGGSKAMYSNNAKVMSVKSWLQERRLILCGCVALAGARDLKQAILGSVGRGLERRY